jgi:hypothetical protein
VSIADVAEEALDIGLAQIERRTQRKRARGALEPRRLNARRESRH